MTHVRDLLDLPKRINKGDFVLSLSEGVTQAEETVASYAITPSLQQSFGNCLKIIDSALTNVKSQPAYIHGSFGSGKSHFMAVLNLMLQGHAAPWTRTELHPLRAEFPWLGERKIFQLNLHMIGAQSIEEKVFQAYMSRVKAEFPDAEAPALFTDRELFEDAQGLRVTMGDDAFFKAINEGVSAKASKWGKRAQGFDAQSFDDTIASDDVDKRAKLFSQLTKTLFKSFASQSQKFIDLDRGLGVIARHAKSLGYDAIVIYFDELILWLAGKISDNQFVSDETQKLAKLREAQDDDRPIPIVSFVAKQRDIADLVGKDAAGDVRSAMNASLDWSSGRFETITLEDRNLSAVVEHRVVRPRDAEAKAQIEQAFLKTQKQVGSALGQLLGNASELEDFKKVYPFSPALIDALVAVSECLQRDRTAIRILMELLVNHLDDLSLGQIVPVGDIYDILAAGDDTMDPIQQDRFNRAKDLYNNELLTIIRDQNKTNNKESCQRLRDTYQPKQGCYGCAATACRNDNRLAKTLLLASFVPQAPAFKDFKVSSLVTLNHGSVKTPIPGTEISTVNGKLKKWASQLGQLELGDERDARVSLRLEGVDMAPILASAQAQDNSGYRRRLIQKLLFQSMGLSLDDDAKTTTVQTLFRYTKRKGQLRFGNVRMLLDSAFVCPPEFEWQMVIDYPFDEPGKTPNDDLNHLETVREKVAGPTNPTVVWLPSFFSAKLEQELGELVKLDWLLTGSNATSALQHLRPEDKVRARETMESLRNQKQNLIKDALLQAYGLVKADDETLDPSRSIELEQSFHSLFTPYTPRGILVPTFRDALETRGSQVLATRYPHHPEFPQEFSNAMVEKAVPLLEKVVESGSNRLELDRADFMTLSVVAEPLKYFTVTESTFGFDDSAFSALDRQREQRGVTLPTLENVYDWIDPDGTQGLPRIIAQLIAYAYAQWSGRLFEDHGNAYKFDKLSRLRDELTLRKPELPNESTWHEALRRAGQIFGITLAGQANNARNLQDFCTKVTAKAQSLEQSGVQRIPVLLIKRATTCFPTYDTSAAPRLVTATSAADLVKTLLASRNTPITQVEALAAYTPQTSPHAVIESLKRTPEMLTQLENNTSWMVLDKLPEYQGNETTTEQATLLLTKLNDVFHADELNSHLSGVLPDLTGETLNLKSTPVPAPTQPSRATPPGWKSGASISQTIEVSDRGALRDTIANAIEADLENIPDGAQVKAELSIRLTYLEPGSEG